MIRNKLDILLLLAILYSNLLLGLCIEPISMTIGAIGMAGIGYFFKDPVKQVTWCKLNECCIDEYIKDTLPSFDNIFGQHIAKKHLIAALNSHNQRRKDSKKPLVISLHGTPGVGKNFMVDMLVKHRYVKGYQSEYVHAYYGRTHFPLQSEVELYQKMLRSTIYETIAKCPRSIFVFDEVDKMPTGLFEFITSMLDYGFKQKNMDFSQAIFIFISNTGGIQIADQLAKLINLGTLRNEAQLFQFESILEQAAYNEKGGLEKSGPIQKAVIDYFIPFLPLEKLHVKECIKALLGVEPSPKFLEKVMQYIPFEKKYDLFAESGCKKLDKKVLALYNLEE